MNSTQSEVELRVARQEIRSLQQTIVALREALDDATSDAEYRMRHQIDREVAISRQLRETVRDLREELEQDQSGTELLDASRGEVSELRETVRLLRSQLEEEGERAKEELSAAERRHREEVETLQKALASLRKQLEQRDGE